MKYCLKQNVNRHCISPLSKNINITLQLKYAILYYVQLIFEKKNPCVALYTVCRVIVAHKLGVNRYLIGKKLLSFLRKVGCKHQHGEKQSAQKALISIAGTIWHASDLSRYVGEIGEEIQAWAPTPGGGDGVTRPPVRK